MADDFILSIFYNLFIFLRKKLNYVPIVYYILKIELINLGQ